MSLKINVFKTEAEVLDNIALYFIEAAGNAIAAKQRFCVALSGGSSPKKMYELLASVYKNKIDWQKVDFFFGDERYVPQTDANSNYAMAKLALFDPLQIDPSQIFAVDTTLNPDEAAANYTATISKYFKADKLSFDLILLGLGDNSHTASLFPFTPVLHDSTASVKAVFLQDQNVYRITFTAPLINLGNQVAFLVYGQLKAAAVQHVIEDEKNIENYPAQLIQPLSRQPDWFIDEAAAAHLSKALLQ